MTMDGLSIKNLTGAVKAFADAADQNNDGVIDKNEVKLFNQFVNGAQLTQDKGLKVERERVGDAVAPDDPKKARKAENKTYKDLFGKSEVADVKLAENEANRRVIREFNKLKGTVSPDDLNKAIAARPDMADYNGDAEGYKKALDTWATNVEHTLEKSIMQHTSDVGDAIMMQNAANTGAILAGEAALAAQVEQNTEKLENAVHQEAADTRDTVRQEGAKTRSAVHAEGAATRAEVHNEAREIRNTVREEGTNTRNVVREEGAKTRNVVREEAVETRYTVRKEAVDTRNTVRQTAQETQEIETAADNVATSLNVGGARHTEKTRATVLSLKDEIVRSALSHERKLELLDELAKLSVNKIDDNKLKSMKEKVEREASRTFKSKESVVKQEKPEKEEPVYEEPYYEKEGWTGPSSDASKPESKKPESKKSDDLNDKKGEPDMPSLTQPDMPFKNMKDLFKELKK